MNAGRPARAMRISGAWRIGRKARSWTWWGKRVLSALLLALPMLFYLAVAGYWQWHDLYPITGDEPHYLLVADSLVRDHDVLVRNNYFAEDTAVRRVTGEGLSEPQHLAGHVQGQFSIRGVGLPLVVALPYYAGGEMYGVAAARMFMALLAGLLPFLLYRAAYQVIGSKPWSVVVALTFSLGLPFLAASNQIYPDLLAGMIILYVAERTFAIFRGGHERRISALSAFVVGVLISCLPWLHVRLLAPAMVLLLGYVYAVVTARSDHAPHSGRRGWLVPVGTVALSLVLLGYFNHVAFENISGPWNSGNLRSGIRQTGMVFLRFHWDHTHGMFMQQPFLLLGLMGIAPLVKANWRAALLFGALYMSVLLPAAMNPTAGLGASFAGRYWWAVVSLWIFPAAFAIELLLRRGRAAVLSLCAASVVLQASLVGTWLRSGLMYNNSGLMYNSENTPAWLSSTTDFYARLFDPNLRAAELWLRLPLFRDLDSYLSHPPNYVFVSFGLLLAVIGWLWRRGATRWVGGTWVVFLVIGTSIVAFIPPAVEPLSFPAQALPGQTGTLNGDSRVATEGESRRGHLIFGPNVVLPPGSYELALEYESGSEPGAPAARWDVVSDAATNTIDSGDLPPSTTNGGTFTCKISVGEVLPPSAALEFRVWYPGQGNLKVERLTIAPLTQPSASTQPEGNRTVPVASPGSVPLQWDAP